MKDQSKIFELELALPDEKLKIWEKSLLGFDTCFNDIKDKLRLLDSSSLNQWNEKFHGGSLQVCKLMDQLYPFVIFHGDVGTGKTTFAECIANRLVYELKLSDESVLFRLSNNIRGTGLVGEFTTLVNEAFQQVKVEAKKGDQVVLIIDEGDSIGETRSQTQSHHEDKAAVNTLIQGIDSLRKLNGKVIVFLCTNRFSVIDPALIRRALVVKKFSRPSADEMRKLFEMDLCDLNLRDSDFKKLVKLTSEKGNSPGMTFSDIRTRLYPSALASACPEERLTIAHLISAAKSIEPSPIMESD